MGGFVLIYAAVKRIYRPMGEVVQEIRRHSNSIGTDELQIIHDTFRDMRTSEEEMKHRLEEHYVFLREKILKDLLFGIMVDGDLNELKKQYDLQYLNSAVSVTVVEYVEIEHLKGFLGRNDFNTVKAEVLEYLKNDLKFDRMEIFEIHESQFVIITAGYTEAEVVQRVASSLNLVEICYDITLLGAVGNLCDNLEQIRIPYYDAVNMLGYKALFANRNMVSLKDLQHMQAYYYPFELERDLIDYVQQGKHKAVEALLDNIIERNMALRPGEDAVRELKFAVTATIKRAVRTLGITADTIFREDDFTRWQDTDEDIESLGANARRFFLQICSTALHVREEKGNSVLHSLLEYIREHYMYDISLSELADKYQVSQSYIGKLFRENLQTTFKDYLNQYRVDVAKKLLTDHPAMKINAVAEQVGFINTVTFNRVFKRYEGIAPGEYRKKAADGDWNAQA